MRVLLVGSRVLPFRHAGDKNYWLDVIHGLQRLGHDVEVASIMTERFPNNGFSLRRIEPVQVHFTRDHRFNGDHGHLTGTNNYASKTVSMPRIVRELRRLRREFQPDVMHFIDNYGPAMIGLRPSFSGLPLTISAPTYQPDIPLYDWFLQASFKSFDTIVPLSDAYRRRLLELGFAPHRVRTIRWGVNTERFTPPSEAQRRAAREALGFDRDELVVLWTGFCQQATEVDLRLALRTAELALRRDPDGHGFLFCFKPEHFKPSYRAFEQPPGIRMFGSAEAFQTARAAADVLLCPLQDRRSTAAPPLAWIECLAMGIPIVTTPIPGSEEVVIEGRSGFVASTEDEASRRLQWMREDDALRDSLRAGARDIAMDRFSVEQSVGRYTDLWSTFPNA